MNELIHCTSRELPKDVKLLPITEEEALIYKGTVYAVKKHCKSGEYTEYYVVKNDD